MNPPKYMGIPKLPLQWPYLMHLILVCCQVLFRRSLQGGVAQYSLQSVLDFLKQNKLDKYCASFQESGMDGDLLLEADDGVLKELGVSISIERIKIKTKYKKK